MKGGVLPRLDAEDAFPQGPHRASGVVLRRKDAPAKSQNLLLFLKSYGAIWVNAPGADGSKNRFGAGTEPLAWGDFDLYQSPRRLYLRGADVREAFLKVRGSRRALFTAVSWCGELASRLPNRAESDSLLSLLWGSMKNLACGINPTLLRVRFAWRWGNLWGVAPSLDSCSSCGRKIYSDYEGVVFRTRTGLLCDRCYHIKTAYEPLATPALRDIFLSATLPLDKFTSWAATRGQDATDRDMEICVSWLFSFL
ncbi:MAG: DNA repair protein RecO [Synergistaceae bacterium]|nr:DNA repair protein RecO [Synergistaceae bacterium]